MQARLLPMGLLGLLATASTLPASPGTNPLATPALRVTAQEASEGSKARQEEKQRIAAEQQELVRRAERLQRMMQRLLKRYRSEKRQKYVVLLEKGLEFLEKAGLLDRLTEAKAALQGSQVGKALDSQRKAVENVERLLEILLDRNSVQDLESESQRVEAQLRDLNRLQRSQRNLQKEIDKLRKSAQSTLEKAIAKELETLAKEQREAAARNASRSSALQDRIEKALAGLDSLAKLGKDLEKSLEREAAGSKQGQDSRDREAQIEDLAQGIRGLLEDLARSEKSEDLAKRLGELSRAARKNGMDRAGRESSAESMDRVAKKLAEAAKALQVKARLKNKAAGKQEDQKAAESLRRGAKELERRAEALRNGTRGDEEAAETLEQSSKSMGKMARESDQLAAKRARSLSKSAKSSRQQTADQDPATPKTPEDKQRDEATQKALANAEEELKNAAKALDRPLEPPSASDTKTEDQKRATRKLARQLAEQRAQKALRELMSALSAERAKRRTTENLARQMESRLAAERRKLRGEAGKDPAAQEALRELDRAQKAMQDLRSSRSSASKRDPKTASASPPRSDLRSSQATKEARARVANARKALQKRAQELRSKAKQGNEEELRKAAEASRRAEDLAGRMQKAADEGKLTPEQQQAAKPAIDAARKQLQAAEQKIAQGSPRSAARSQTRAAESLEKASQRMQASRPLGKQQKAELAKLEKRQKDLAREILQLAKRVDPKKNKKAQQHLQQAAKAASAASKKLEQQDADGAQEAQEQTQKQLDEARKQLQEEQDRYLRLRQEELLFKISEEVQALATKQAGIHSRSLELVAELGERSRVPRKMRGPIRELGRLQSEIGKRATFLSENLEKEQSLVFTYVLKGVATDSRELTHLLSARRPQMGLYVLGLQEEIQESLSSLLKALKREIRRKKQEAKKKQDKKKDEKKPKNTNEGDRKKRLVPDIAELKMLKELELKLRERIESFLRLKERLGGDLGSIEESTLNRLSLKHSGISELFRKFLGTRGLGGNSPHGKSEDGEAPKKGGDSGEKKGK